MSIFPPSSIIYGIMVHFPKSKLQHIGKLVWMIPIFRNSEI